MLNNTQVSQFRKWAQGKGFSEIEIANEIARKNQELAKQTIQKQPISEQNIPKIQQKQVVIQNKQQPNVLQTVGNVAGATANLLFNRTANMANKIKSTFNIDKYQSSLQTTNDKLYEESRKLLNQALKEKDPNKKKQLLNQSRELDFAASSNTEKFTKQLDQFQKTTKLTGKETNLDMAGNYARDFVGLAGEGAMWALPIGKVVEGAVLIKGMPLVTKILRGAITGATQGSIYNLTTPENITNKDRALKTGRGALTGGLVGGGLNAATGITGNAFKGVKQFISNKMAQGYGKASPSLYQRAIEEHGIDLNKIIKKYVPAGSNYDDMLGLSNQRGSGGIIGEKMQQAEQRIDEAIKSSGITIKVSGSDLIKELTKQQKSLRQTVGNKTNIDALNTIINETKQLFKNGITAKKLLSMKRAADNKFGSAIVDENTGSVAAQAQKILANFARSKLKTILPTVKKALDEETELYTLKEVLNRARGTASTQGSEIRVGQFQSLLDLVNPFKYGSAVANTPKLSSLIMNITSNKKPIEDTLIKNGIKDASTLSEKIVNGIIDIVRGASVVNTSKGKQEQKGIIDDILSENKDNDENIDNTTQEEETIQIQNEETGEVRTIKKSELSQYGLGDQQEQKGIINKKDLVIAMIADLQQTGGKNIPELKTILDSYEKVFEEDKTEKKKISATTEKNILLARSGIRALDEIEEILSKDPNKVLKSVIPGKLGARDYDSAAFRAVEGLLRARSGAAVPETEVRRYMRANLPSLGDSPEEIRFKLDAFRKDLEEVANSGSELEDIESIIEK